MYSINYNPKRLTSEMQYGFYYDWGGKGHQLKKLLNFYFFRFSIGQLYC